MFGRKLKNQISKLKAQITLLTIDKEAIEKASEEMAAKYRDDLVRLDKVKAENAELKKQIEELKLKISRKGQNRGTDGRFAKKVESTSEWSPAPRDEKEFKVGDKVKIVDGFDPEKHRDDPVIFIMDAYVGLIGVVQSVYDDGDVIAMYDDGAKWALMKEWLEHVE